MSPEVLQLDRLRPLLSHRELGPDGDVQLASHLVLPEEPLLVGEDLLHVEVFLIPEAAHQLLPLVGILLRYLTMLLLLLILVCVRIHC